jgi:hypothetical protein
MGSYMKFFIILFGLLNLANATTLERNPITGELVTDHDIEELKAEIKVLKSKIKKHKNEPNKITYKSNINDDAYKARKSCLMSEKTAEECDRLFPVVKKTFKISYEVKNVEPEEQKEMEKNDRLKSLMGEEPSSLNSDPVDVEA